MRDFTWVIAILLGGTGTVREFTDLAETFQAAGNLSPRLVLQCLHKNCLGLAMGIYTCYFLLVWMFLCCWDK